MENHQAIASALGLLGCLLTGLGAAQVNPFERIGIETDTISMEVNQESGLPFEDFIRIAEHSMNMAVRYSPEMVKDWSLVWRGTQRMRKSDFPMFFQALAYQRNLLCRMKKIDDTTVALLSAGVPAQWWLPPIQDFHFLPPGDLEREDPAKAGADGRQVLSWYRLQHGSPVEAAKAIDPWLPGLGIGICGDDQTLLLQGPRAKALTAISLLRRMDVPPDNRPVLVTAVELGFLAATAAAPHLAALLDPRVLREQPEAVRPPILVLASEEGDALILCGTEDQMERAKELIAILDRPAK